MGVKETKKNFMEGLALSFSASSAAEKLKTAGPLVKSDVTATLQIVMPRDCFDEITTEQLKNPVFEERLANLVFEMHYNQIYEKICVRVVKKILADEMLKREKDAESAFGLGFGYGDNDG